jgi:TolA-binding protein
MKPTERVSYIKNRIAEGTRWLQNQKDVDTFSELYFLLARSMAAAEFTRENVIGAYEEALARGSARSDYTAEGLLYLSETLPAEDFAHAVTQWATKSTHLCRDLHYTTGKLESANDWSGFTVILDTLFSMPESESTPRTSVAKAIEGTLQTDGAWAGKYQAYCRDKAELTDYVFYGRQKAVRKAIASGDHRKAALTLREIVDACTFPRSKAAYEFALCEQLAAGQDRAGATAQLRSFTETWQGKNERLVQQALLLLGQTLIESGNVEQAMDCFLRVMIESTETTERSKANYILGYCEMLLGNFEEAANTFDLLFREYPGSVYAEKADAHLERIRQFVSSESAAQN